MAFEGTMEVKVGNSYQKAYPATKAKLVDGLDSWLAKLNLRQPNIHYRVGDIAYDPVLKTNQYLECIAVASNAAVSGAAISIDATTNTATDGGITWAIRTVGNSHTAERLAKPVQINGVAFDGSHDINISSDSIDRKSYIVDGLKVSGINGHTMTVSSGHAIIGGRNVTYNGGTIDMKKRSAGLITLTADGALFNHEVSGYNHSWWINNNTIGCWVFNARLSGEHFQNLAFGISKLAQDCAFIPHGSFSIDAYADYGIHTMGNKDSYVDLDPDANYPATMLSGNIDGEITLICALDNPYVVQEIFRMSKGDAYRLRTDANGNLYVDGNRLNFRVEPHEPFIVTMQNDLAHGCFSVFVNGQELLHTDNRAFPAPDKTVPVRLGKNAVSTEPCAAVYSFLEMSRNVRLASDISAIHNRYLFFNTYYKRTVSYPRTTAYTDKIEYNFDDVSKFKGTVTGLWSRRNLNGLGNELHFDGNGNHKAIFSDFIVMPKEFTFIAVINPDAINKQNCVVGSTNTEEFKFTCSHTDGDDTINVNNAAGMSFWCGRTNGSQWITSGLKPTPGQDNFIAVTVTDQEFTFFLNGKVVRRQNPCWKKVVASDSISLGTFNKDTLPANDYRGYMSYFLYVPHALRDGEVNTIYQQVFKKGMRSIIDDVTDQNNEIVLAYARADEDDIYMYDDSDYYIGRREREFFGNRWKFLGWRWVQNTNLNPAASLVSWPNPFRRGNIDTKFVYAESPSYNRMKEIAPAYGFSVPTPTDHYGVSRVVSPTNGYMQTIDAYVGNHIVFTEGAWKNAGYVGCYARVMDQVEDEYWL